MNPDPTNPYYMAATALRERAAQRDRERRAVLHARAVARRRKAKRGGPR